MMQLPARSRLMTTLNPAKDWDWDKETQSRILQKLDFIYTMLGNAFRDKKKTAKFKPEAQFEPDYVKLAKDEAKTRQNANKRLTAHELDEVKAFWKRKNYQATFIEETNDTKD